MVEKLPERSNGNGHKFTAAQMADALRQTRGIKSLAARSLGCTRQTVDNYIAKFASVKQAYDEAVEVVLDIAEGHVITAINNGDLEESHWYLTKKGAHRGYGRSEPQKVEVSGPDGGPIEIDVRAKILALMEQQEANLADSKGLPQLTAGEPGEDNQQTVPG